MNKNGDKQKHSQTPLCRPPQNDIENVTNAILEILGDKVLF